MDLDELLEELDNTKLKIAPAKTTDTRKKLEVLQSIPISSTNVNRPPQNNYAEWENDGKLITIVNKNSPTMQRGTQKNNLMNICDVLDLDDLTPVGVTGCIDGINGRSRALACNLNEDSWEADILDALKENNI